MDGSVKGEENDPFDMDDPEASIIQDESEIMSDIEEFNAIRGERGPLECFTYYRLGSCKDQLSGKCKYAHGKDAMLKLAEKRAYQLIMGAGAPTEGELSRIIDKFMEERRTRATKPQNKA